MTTAPEEKSEEIDVSEIIERIGNLEKEIRDQKEKFEEKIGKLGNRVGDCEDTIDFICSGGEES